MRHPTDGTLRRLVDEPAGVADTDRQHVAACAACLADLAAVQQDAAVTRAALHTDVAVDVDAGWSRLSHTVTREGRPATAAPRSAAGRRFAAPRWRATLRRPVVAAVAVVALLGAGSAAAAADWLQIFRTEQIAPVTFTDSDLVELPDLSAFGTLEILEEPREQAVSDAATAQQASGLPVPRVRDLPRGVTGQPTFTVVNKVTAEFTFSTEQATRAAAAAGKALPQPPAGLDGTRFRLNAGPGVAAIWPEARGLPALVVARAVAPTAYSAGVPFATAVDYLLSLPGMPPAVASQLRAFSADGTTLPLPVNAEYLKSSGADVNGRPATLLSSRDGVMAGVVWVDNGVVTAVAGSVSTDEVLSVARGLGRS